MSRADFRSAPRDWVVVGVLAGFIGGRESRIQRALSGSLFCQVRRQQNNLVRGFQESAEARIASFAQPSLQFCLAAFYHCRIR